MNTAPSSPLFRKQSIEQQKASIYGSVISEKPVRHSLATAYALIVAFAIFTFVSMASISRKVELSGVVSPRAGVVRLSPPQAGVISDRRVREGQTVQAGDVLFVLTSTHSILKNVDTGQSISKLLSERRDSYKNELLSLNQQIGQRTQSLQTKQASLEGEEAGIDTQISRQQQRVQLAEQALSRFAELQATNFISTSQLQEKQSDLLDQRQRLDDLRRQQSSVLRELTSARADLGELRIQSNRDQESIARNRSAVEQDLLVNDSQREVAIRAPQSGVVTAITAEVGQTVAINQTVASLLPANSELEVEMYTPSRAVGFIKEGMSIHLRYQAYPYQKFGQKSGVVREISATALRPEDFALSSVAGGEKGEPVYRVRARLPQQSVHANGMTYPLKSGMLVDASIPMEKRRLIEWALGPILGFTERQ